MANCKIYILDFGYQHADKLGMIHNCSIGVNSNKNPENQWIKWASYGTLVQHPDLGWILYDTGTDQQAIGENGYTDYYSDFLMDFSPITRTKDQFIEAQLAKIGITPDDIGTVIISHAHFDHTGGLKYFHNANVYWGKADFDDMMEALYTHPGTQEYWAFVKKDIEDINVKKINFVEKDFELCDGIEIINCSGHTPDVLGMIVHAENGTYIFPGDTVDSAGNYGDPDNDIPVVLTGNCYDSISFKKNIMRIHELEKKYKAKQVFFSHDYDAFLTYKKAPEYYD